MTAFCDDIYTSSQVAELFRTAMIRVSDQIDPAKGYAVLKQLADLPDIGKIALNNKSVIDDVLRLRNSTTGTQFRKWFHENCRGEKESIAKEYTSILRDIPAVQTSRGRTIRYITQATIAGAMLPFDPLIGLGAGLTASAIDTFLVERLFKGATPKVFLEKLANIGGRP